MEAATALALLVADGLVADANDPEEPRLMLRRPGFLGRRDRRTADGGGGRAEGILIHLRVELLVLGCFCPAAPPHRRRIRVL